MIKIDLSEVGKCDISMLNRDAKTDINRASLWWSESKQNAVCTALTLSRELRRCGIVPIVSKTKESPELTEAGVEYGTCAKSDVMIVLGGDGSILTTLDDCVHGNIPILGVNLGRLGFLAEVEPDSIGSAARALADGEYHLEERMLLCSADGHIALNEFAFLREQQDENVAEMEILCNGCVVDNIRGDGVLIATPTGSTAYAMACNGPILSPALDCIMVTPVCSHSMYSRSVVLPAESIVNVRNAGERTRVHAYADGSRYSGTDGILQVEISRYEKRAMFLRIGSGDFFDLLHRKFAEWSL